MAPLTSLAVVWSHRDRCGVRDYARQLSDCLPEQLRTIEVDLPTDGRRESWRAVASTANDADVVHVHFEAGLFVPLKPYHDRFVDLLSAIRSPRLITLHGPIPPMVPRWGRSEAYGLRDLVRDIAYAPFFSSWLRRHYQLGEHWIVYDPGLGAEVSRFAGADRVTRMIHPIAVVSRQWKLEESEDATLATPGFIKEHKGYDNLLPALAGARDWRWVLAGGPQHAGDQAFANFLDAELRRTGLCDRVERTGYLNYEQLQRQTLRARLAVFPFRSVTGSGSIALAIALAMPVAATDLPSVRMLLEAGAGIAVLPAAEPEKWGAIIDEFLRSPERLSALAARNAEVGTRETFTACAGRVVSIAEELVSRRRDGL